MNDWLEQTILVTRIEMVIIYLQLALLWLAIMGKKDK